MFHAIIGFIFLGLILIIGLLAGTFLTTFSSGVKDQESRSLMFIPVLVIAVVYFFPILFYFVFPNILTCHSNLIYWNLIRQIKTSILVCIPGSTGNCCFFIYIVVYCRRLFNGFLKGWDNCGTFL